MLEAGFGTAQSVGAAANRPIRDGSISRRHVGQGNLTSLQQDDEPRRDHDRVGDHDAAAVTARYAADKRVARPTPQSLSPQPMLSSDTPEAPLLAA